MMSGHAQGSVCPKIMTCLHYYPKTRKSDTMRSFVAKNCGCACLGLAACMAFTLFSDGHELVVGKHFVPCWIRVRSGVSDENRWAARASEIDG